jgi:hypothetical protein
VKGQVSANHSGISGSGTVWPAREWVQSPKNSICDVEAIEGPTANDDVVARRELILA